MQLKDVKRILDSGKDLENILDSIDWQDFERLCSRVLEEHGWKCDTNFRFKCESRFEIDVKAVKGNKVLLVDCKYWGMRQGKPTQLKYAVEKQIERAGRFSEIRNLENFNKEQEIYPVIITWMDEVIRKHEDVWIVPFSKLNHFLLEIDSYLDGE